MTKDKETLVSEIQSEYHNFSYSENVYDNNSLFELTPDPAKREKMIHAKNDYAFRWSAESCKDKALELIATLVLVMGKNSIQIYELCQNTKNFWMKCGIELTGETSMYINNSDLLIEVAKQNKLLLDKGMSYEQLDVISDLARATSNFLKLAKNPLPMLPNDITNLIILHSAWRKNS